MGVERYFGIDFGTTNTSVVQILNDEHGQREQILGEQGQYPFPSLVAIDKDFKMLFGSQVKSQREALSKNCKVISSFKSILGTGKKIRVFDKEFFPKDILAEYLKWIKENIEKTHNVTITNAAFSFPVSFSRNARTDLINAAKEAGINIESLVSESTAAYLATRKETQGQQRVMVVDWGGGTLDISILEITGNRIKETAVAGEKIGGDDIDKELAQRVHSDINKKLEDKSKALLFEEMPAEQKDKMLTLCERAKIELSKTDDDYPLTIRDYGGYGTKTVNITVDTFDEIIKPIIEKSVYPIIQKALNKAELTAASIDAVVVAGGSSALKLFSYILSTVFGKDKLVKPENYQFISASGAALTHITRGLFRLNDDVGVLLSDGTVFPLLEKEKDGVETGLKKHIFSLVEDSENAYFIFSNGNGRTIYEKVDVPTKGFLKEHLRVEASIGFDQIAHISIKSSSTADVLKREVEIGGLTYYYELQ